MMATSLETILYPVQTLPRAITRRRRLSAYLGGALAGMLATTLGGGDGVVVIAVLSALIAGVSVGGASP